MEVMSTSREKAAKVKMKSTYDKKAKPRMLEVGLMALMRVPGLTGKLDDSWEGPYEIVDKISPVNYQLPFQDELADHKLYTSTCSIHGILQTLVSSD